MILHVIRININQIQLIFENESQLDTRAAIKRSFSQSSEYLDFNTINTNLNHMTISIGNDIQIHDGYFYHEDVVKFNLEGANLKSNVNRLSLKFAMLNLNPDILDYVPFGVMLTLDLVLKNKY